MILPQVLPLTYTPVHAASFLAFPLKELLRVTPFRGCLARVQAFVALN